MQEKEDHLGICVGNFYRMKKNAHTEQKRALDQIHK